MAYRWIFVLVEKEPIYRSQPRPVKTHTQTRTPSPKLLSNIIACTCLGSLRRRSKLWVFTIHVNYKKVVSTREEKKKYVSYWVPIQVEDDPFLTLFSDNILEIKLFNSETEFPNESTNHNISLLVIPTFYSTSA